MPLRLTITSYHKLTPGQCSEKVLDQGQLTIGRGPDNDWVLPDPERLVSSRHCTILNRDGVYYLTDTSTNGVLLVNAGHRLRRGNSEPLQDGETVRLGEYDILVQLGHDIALPGSGNPQTDPFTSFDALMSRQAAGSAPAFAEPAPTPHPAVTAHFQGGSPLDTKPDLFDFLTPPPPGAAPRPDHVPAEQHDFRPPEPVIPPPPATTLAPPPAGGAPLIPADWDPFAELLGNTPAPSATPVAQPLPTAEPTPLAMPFADPGITQQPQPQPQPQQEQERELERYESRSVRRDVTVAGRFVQRGEEAIRMLEIATSVTLTARRRGRCVGRVRSVRARCGRARRWAGRLCRPRAADTDSAAA